MKPYPLDPALPRRGAVEPRGGTGEFTLSRPLIHFVTVTDASDERTQPVGSHYFMFMESGCSRRGHRSQTALSGAAGPGHAAGVARRVPARVSGRDDAASVGLCRDALRGGWGVKWGIGALG